jgi:hypothetical protein
VRNLNSPEGRGVTYQEAGGWNMCISFRGYARIQVWYINSAFGISTDRNYAGIRGTDSLKRHRLSALVIAV